MKSVDITVIFSQHKTSGLWKAESKDVPGLLVFDKDRRALAEHMPSIICAAYEKLGDTVLTIQSNGLDPDWLASDEIHASVLLAAA